MKSKEFIGLSACCMILTALGIDIMLPAFGAVRDYFSLTENTPNTAYVVMAFFAGQMFQVVFGIISDRFGRLPVLRVGFPLYIIAGIAAAFSESFAIMLVCRFVAGIGAAAVFMTTMACVRDRSEGDAMARVMSFIFTIFLFTPVVAPFLGAALLQFASWRYVFLTPPAFGLLVFAWSFRLKETLLPRSRQKVSINNMRINLRAVLTNPFFVRYTAVTTLLFGGISAYVSNAEYMIGEVYQKPQLFAWVFAAVGMVMAFGAFTNTRLAATFGAQKSIRGLITAYVLVGLCLVVFTYIDRPLPCMYLFFTGMALLLGINLAIEPNSSALAMQTVGQSAGLASSLYGTCFFFTGSIIGSVISFFLLKGLFAMSVCYLLIGLAAWLLAFSKASPAPAEVSSRQP